MAQAGARRTLCMLLLTVLVLAFSWTLASCQSDELETLSATTESTLQTVTFRATVGGTTADSRAQVLLDNQDASAEYFLWNEGDSISVYDLGADGTSIPTSAMTFGISDYSDDSPSATASFTGQAGIDTGNAILAVYPAGNADVSDGYLTLEIADTAAMGAYADEAVVDYLSKRMYMCATATMADGGSDLPFEQLTTMMRITYRNATDTVQTLDNVEVAASKALFGTTARLDLATATTTVTATTKTLQQTFDPLPVAVGDSIDFYLLFFAGNDEFGSSTMTITIGDASTELRPTLFSSSSDYSHDTFATGARYWLDLTQGDDGLDFTQSQGETDDYVILYSSTNALLCASLEAMYYSEGVYRDYGGNAHIPKSFIEETTVIDFRQSGIENMLTLDGLELFVNLDTLYCHRVKTISLSGFEKLTYADCYWSSNNVNLVSLDVSDCPSLTTLICDDCYTLTELSITNCPSLTTLDLSGASQLTSLDVTAFPALTTLDCYNCYGLTSLNVAGLTQLETLDLTSCSGLTSLDVSSLASLVTLDCTGCTGLTTLDVSDLTALVTLDCEGSKMTLTSVNASGCTSLAFFNSNSIYDTLTTLDFTGCKALVSVDCGWCQHLTGDFDFSDCTALEYVNFEECYLITSLLLPRCMALTTVDLEDCSALVNLDLTGCNALESLNLESCTLMSSELDLSGCTALTDLNLDQCHALSVLNLSGCTSLTDLSSEWPSNITHLDVSYCTALEYAYAGDKTESLSTKGCTALKELALGACSGITQVDISDLESLEKLDVSCSYVTELDASNLKSLNYVIGSGGCTKLDVSNCTALEQLIWNNGLFRDRSGALASLNAENCTALKNLQVPYNNVESLDLSTCIALEYLSCNGNALQTLNVGQCTALQYLYCYGNEIGALDVTPCTALLHLECDSNQLALLDLSQCTSLNYLKCPYNHLASLDISQCPSLGTCKCYGQTDVDGNSITLSLYLTQAQAERFTERSDVSFVIVAD